MVAFIVKVFGEKVNLKLVVKTFYWMIGGKILFTPSRAFAARLGEDMI